MEMKPVWLAGRRPGQRAQSRFMSAEIEDTKLPGEVEIECWLEADDWLPLEATARWKG